MIEGVVEAGGWSREREGDELSIIRVAGGVIEMRSEAEIAMVMFGGWRCNR